MSREEEKEFFGERVKNLGAAGQYVPLFPILISKNSNFFLGDDEIWERNNTTLFSSPAILKLFSLVIVHPRACIYDIGSRLFSKRNSYKRTIRNIFNLGVVYALDFDK
jgi:hypothetical protein